MINLKSPEEIKIMAEAGRIAGEVLEKAASAAHPGVSTLELDQLAEDLIRRAGGESGFKKVDGYYHTICTAPNEDVVHGIPSDRTLRDGDILSIDLGAFYYGFHSDTALTIPIGNIPESAREFLAVGEQALYAGIAQAKLGQKTGDISAAIESVLKSHGYAIVESLTGHGVGRNLHEEPLIPNLGRPSTGVPLQEGMVIALEPIYTNGSPDVKLQDDGWTITSADATLAAQFEHTIAVTPDGPKILTKRPSEIVP